MRTTILDPLYIARGYTEAYWGYYSSSEERAAQSGTYEAGAQASVFFPIDQDIGDTRFLSAVGTVTGVVILPYKCCGGTTQTSVSQLPNPRPGRQTNVRLLTRNVSTAAKITWYLDGVRVPPAGTLVNPKRDTVWTGTVNAAGVHNWKVEIIDGSPQTKTTINWTQRYQ